MIKRILLTTLCVFVISGLAYAEGTVAQKEISGTYYTFLGDNMAMATFTIADDSGSVPLTSFLQAYRIFGWYLMSVEVKTSSDDAITILIKTDLGTDLFNQAFASATSGEIKNADDRWPIYATPKIDITNMSSDTATVRIIFVK